MDDWGELAEKQMQSIVRRSLDSFSFQYNFNPPATTEDLKAADDDVTIKPNKTLKDYFMENKENCGDDDEEDEDDLSAAEQFLLKMILHSKLETTTDIEVRRRKDNSPLNAAKSFDQLPIPPNLLRVIYAMNFISPSKIQEISLPTLLANPPVNMIAQSQSGTGKTAAFLLVSIARINTDLNHPQVLILAPTFELALQIGDVAKKMVTFCQSVTIRYAVREEKVARNEFLSEHMIIGTPGKVFEWAKRCRCFDISKIKVFVLDEADVMISLQGHQDQCIRIHQLLSKECQMLLFSATYTQEIIDFAEQIIADPIIIRVPREEETLDNIQQYFIRCSSSDVKYDALRNIYGAISVGQTMIFCRTKRTACWLGQKFSADGHSVGYLSSDLTMKERCDVITSFRKGKEKVLITTNVCARGIDIEQITMVVNFDLPITVQGKADCETYLHRIGRTGRFGKNGLAINLVCSARDEQILSDIEQHFGKPIKKIDAENVDDLEAMV